jgi:hypothetical protein
MAKRGEIKNTVILLLTNHPHLREDANSLITHIWRHQARGQFITNAEDIFTAISNKSLWNAESIRRTRRKVIADYPHLAPTDETQERNRVLEQTIRVKQGEL